MTRHLDDEHMFALTSAADAPAQRLRFAVRAEWDLEDRALGRAVPARVAVRSGRRPKGLLACQSVRDWRVWIRTGQAASRPERTGAWVPAPSRWTEVARLTLVLTNGDRAAETGVGSLFGALQWSLHAGPLGPMLLQLEERERVDIDAFADRCALLLDELQVSTRVGGQGVGHRLAQLAVDEECLLPDDLVYLHACAIPPRYGPSPWTNAEDIPREVWRPRQEALLRQYRRWGLRELRRPAVEVPGRRMPPSPDDSAYFWRCVDEDGRAILDRADLGCRT